MLNRELLKYFIIALSISISSCDKETTFESEPKNINPTCYINKPSDGYSFPSSCHIEIRVAASDEDGQITKVDFYVDDRLLYEDNEYPYQYIFDTSTESNGEKLIHAVAIDDDGAFTCDSVTINIGWVYNQPEQINDGWETTHLDSVGLNTKILCDLIYTINQHENHLIHGILIVRHGKLVFEQYFNGLTHPTWGEIEVVFNKERLHVLSSVTKSFTSALLGIAIDRGFIPNINEKVFTYYPELSDLITTEKDNITLENLIMMASGLKWDDTVGGNSDLAQFINIAISTNEDLVKFILEKDMTDLPGTTFHYSGGNTNLVGNVIQKASGLRLDEFAKKYLFEPLGISDSWWWLLRPDFVYASGDIALKPRDIAKFGQLFLQNGNWNGEQIISEEWIRLSATPQFDFTWSDWAQIYYGFTGYSYGWWMKNESYGQGAYAASGWGGQEIVILPEYDMVVVLTGGSYWDDPFMKPKVIMERFVLPSIK